MNILKITQRSIVLAAALASIGAHAYPDRPIKIVVPFAADGGTDV